MATTRSENVSETSETDSAAIGGYDCVAYFEQGGPVSGTAAHAVHHQGATWLFSSQENVSAFQASPERYIPAYNGQCAFATSLGKEEVGDPTKWQVSDGRLFLNSNAVAHLLWRLLPGRRASADRHWKSARSDA